MAFVTIGVGAAIGGYQKIDLVHHLLGVGVRPQRHRQIIKRAIKISGRLQRAAVHPQHAIALVIGKEIAGRERIDKFRAKGHTRHFKPTFATIDDGTNDITRVQVVGVGEGFTNQNGINLATFQHTATAQKHPVQWRFPLIGDRDNLP